MANLIKEELTLKELEKMKREIILVGLGEIGKETQLAMERLWLNAYSLGIENLAKQVVRTLRDAATDIEELAK